MIAEQIIQAYNSLNWYTMRYWYQNFYFNRIKKMLDKS